MFRQAAAATAMAIFTGTQAAKTGSGSFAGVGSLDYDIKFGTNEGVMSWKLGAKGVTFTDKADFAVESLVCSPIGSDKYTCVLAYIVDPKTDKTLGIDVWYSVGQKTFTDTESIATTLGAPSCEETFTGNTLT